jgi:DNA-directed RNA polymerase subunit D
MKLKKIQSSKDNLKMSFSAEDCSEAFLNGIRRLIIEEVPTLAIEDVEFKDNNSALYDEMLALRLGLAPIKTDLSSYSLPKNEDEINERAASCTLQINLKSSKKGYVYAGGAKSSDPKCTFVNEETPLVKLIEGQKVDMTMWAVMGQGKDHIKWSPGLVWYSQKADIKVNNNSELMNEFKGKYPDQIFDGDKISKDKIIELNLIDAVDRVCDDIVKVDFQEDNFVFHVESWGQLECQEMLVKAAEILEEKASELESQL